MGSNKNTVDYIVEQIKGAGAISAKKMFGEYGIYCDNKIVALVCDDQLFVKPTQAGKEYVGNFVESCPYPGAKPYILISGDMWDDWDNPYQSRLETRVVSVDDNCVLFEETIAFSFSGGQESDKATVNGLAILDSEIAGQLIYYTLPSNHLLVPHDPVVMEIDWPRRYIPVIFGNTSFRRQLK